MAYGLQEITPELLKQTQKAWELVVGEEEFASEFQALFEWIGCHIDYADPKGNSLAYAIVDDGQKIASGFGEIVSTKHHGGRKLGGLTKLLKVMVTPQYWEIASHKQEIIGIFVAAIKGVTKISHQNKSKTIKIYGRTDSLLELLQGIHDSMQADEQSAKLITTCIKGRWLEIAVK